MPNQHKTPMLGWHPPAELSAWARAEAGRRGVALKVILDEALREYHERVTATDEHCRSHDGLNRAGQILEAGGCIEVAIKNVGDTLCVPQQLIADCIAGLPAEQLL